MTLATVLDSAALGPAAREALASIAALPEGGSAWLVGGTVRELLSGASPADLDIAVPAGAFDLGRALAARLGGAFVALDEGRGACRVAWRAQVDIVDFRAPTLDGDLRARDFTVNALAAPMAALVRDGRAPVTDPTGGLADLAARTVRLAGPGALADDPVRILRGVRLGLRPGWGLDPGVVSAARLAAPGLAAVAGERVRDELVAMLASDGAGRGLRRLAELGAMAVLLPESLAMRATPQPPPHQFDVWEHSLRTVEAADVLVAWAGGLEPGGHALAAHLRERLGDGMTRAEALKLAALLHDVAKPDTRSEIGGRLRFLGHDVLGAERARAVAERLRLSRRASGVIERLVRHHLRPMHLAKAGTLTPRSRYRFFRDLGDETRDLLLLATADAAGLRGDSPLGVWIGPSGSLIRALMAGIQPARAAAAASPLIRGEDVMQRFGLAPGPEVGRLLALAREAQALGVVSSRAEVLAFLSAHLGDGRAAPAPASPPPGSSPPKPAFLDSATEGP
jgi:putative nucleotidyltransferase with HDIG domain